MASSLRLRVRLSEDTKECFERQGINIAWDGEELLAITCEDGQETPLTIEGVADWVETRVENMHERQTGGEDKADVRARSIRKHRAPKVLPWDDDASRHLGDGDTIIADLTALTDSMARKEQERERQVERDLEEIRKSLRFSLNDQVLCFCGPRWLPGHVVGSAVPVDSWPPVLPYLVKTDPIPGLPSKTISVPNDKDAVCTQEVCFDPQSELHLVKAAATLLTGSQRPKLRFAVGDKVACRLRNDPKDGLESWAAGTVSSIWPGLPGELKWEMGSVSGEFPSVVAYKVDLSKGGWIFCHRDHHTLIRREGMQPQTRVKGISKRMEVRRAKDGSREQVDHQTERRKRMLDSDSDSDMDL
jgi:hypothetical protein